MSVEDSESRHFELTFGGVFSGRSWPKIGPGIIFVGDFGKFETFFAKICAHSEPYRYILAGIFEILTFYGNIAFPVTMETRCFHKKLKFQRYPPKDLCTARYEGKSSKKKVSNFSKTSKKIIPGPIFGLRKTQPNVCSNRRDSESWTDIDRQKQRLRHEI